MHRTAVALILLTIPLLANPHLGPVTDIAVSELGVVSVSQAGICKGTGERLELVARPPIRVTSVFSAPHSKSIIFAGGRPGEEGSFGSLILDPNDEPEIHRVADDLIHDLALAPSGTAAACSDGVIRFLDDNPYNSRWSHRHKHTAAATAVAFSPDGKWLASAGLDGVVMISAADAGPNDESLQLLDHTAGVECLAWSADSKFLASGSRDSKVRLHEAGGKLVRTYNGLGMEDEPVAGRVESRVLALAWNEHALVAGTSKGTLHRLSLDDDTTTKLPRDGGDPIYSLAFGLKGELLVGGHSRLQVIETAR